MPRDWKARLASDQVLPGNWLEMPVTGMEAEFNVVLDGEEIDPRKYWGSPDAFIQAPMLWRTRSSFQVPTGGAVYFDRGVIEVVTPVIELRRGCTARVVRNLWEQIGFVRDELTAWEQRTGHHVRLKAYSGHYNISFELTPEEQGPGRTIQDLALLLAYVLPMPVALVGCNRRSTGVGVRPRENRIEVTVDFTPDPGMMIATATLIIGIVREMLAWPSYELDLLDRLPIPVVKDVVPGKHTTRKGWLTKDFHYPQSPYTCNVDARIWEARDGRVMSLRGMSREVAWYFRESIRRFADPFSYRLLFSILEGQTPSLLELPDRPAAYEDVGRLCRWGRVLPALKAHAARGKWTVVGEAVWTTEGSWSDWKLARDKERARHVQRPATPDPAASDAAEARTKRRADLPAPPPRRAGFAPVAVSLPPLASAVKLRGLAPGFDRRQLALNGAAGDRRGQLRRIERRVQERRYTRAQMPFPDRRLTRSSYEKVFLKLVSGGRLRIGSETFTPVGMRGWYHAVFRRDSDGEERMLTVDQLLRKLSDWQ